MQEDQSDRFGDAVLEEVSSMLKEMLLSREEHLKPA